MHIHSMAYQSVAMVIPMHHGISNHFYCLQGDKKCLPNMYIEGCTHVNRVISNGRKKVTQLHSILSNRNINLSAQGLLLLSVLCPSIPW